MLVGYMRVSTDSDRQVLDLQRDALLSAGVDERHLFEDRVSGSRGDRVGLAQALAFLRPGDCLVVWKLDRLGRSLPHLLTTVTDLNTRGIAFRSLTEQMDTTTPQGEFLFHVFGALAQFERSLIQERVQAGLAAARHHRCREARGGDHGPRQRRHQGRGLSHLRRQAQHADRLPGPDRMVCRHQGQGDMSGTTTATERSPDRGAIRSADGAA
jgi:DNA invertase Pin-like site-specific DNA recombinase